MPTSEDDPPGWWLEDRPVKLSHDTLVHWATQIDDEYWTKLCQWGSIHYGYVEDCEGMVPTCLVCVARHGGE
jgi:hypothetical protein